MSQPIKIGHWHRGSYFLASIILVLSLFDSGAAQTTAFTYQGKLADNNGNPLSGNYDFQFSLFDQLAAGAQIGSTQTVTNLTVNNGIFAVTLDFVNCAGCSCATCFNGSPRFLAIAVKLTGGGSYTPLTPRQPLTSTPYSVRSLNATTSDGLSTACVNCVTSNQIQSVSGGAVSGPIPVTSIPPGNANYIQNTTSQQLSSNFNITGNGVIGGSVGVGTATPGYKIEVIDSSNSGLRVQTNTTGGTVASFGGNGDFIIDAPSNPGGRFTVLENGFVGIGTPAPTAKLHVLGDGLFTGNVGIGAAIPSHKLEVTKPVSGSSVLSATNTFSGNNEGIGIEGTSVNNPGFGVGGKFQGGNQGVAGRADAMTFSQSAYGVTGIATGSGGTRIGMSGVSSVTFGALVGTGVQGEAIGPATENAGVNGIANGATINYGVLGQASGPATTNYGVYGTASGATTNWAGLFDGSLRVAMSTSGGTLASFGGSGNFEIDSPGFAGGRLRVAESGLVTIGRSGVGGDLTVFGTTLLNTVTIANGATLNVLGTAGSTTLCRNASAQISTCSSSLRYKQNIHPFASGLSLINRLHPVVFNWKANNEPDLGLVAEEVAKVEPLLVTRNDKGEVEGVKYDRISALIINAVKEQQHQILAQERQVNIQQRQIDQYRTKLAAEQRQIFRQQQELASLKRLLCADHPHAAACRARKTMN
jgi:hypothetical protein